MHNHLKFRPNSRLVTPKQTKLCLSWDYFWNITTQVWLTSLQDMEVNTELCLRRFPRVKMILMIFTSRRWSCLLLLHPASCFADRPLPLPSSKARLAKPSGRQEERAERENWQTQIAERHNQSSVKVFWKSYQSRKEFISLEGASQMPVAWIIWDLAVWMPWA